MTQDHLLLNFEKSNSRIICLYTDFKDIVDEEVHSLVNNVVSENLVYVMYTSGSTGKPKGVEICHYGIARLLFGVEYVNLDSQQRILHMAPISFDASTFEIWAALLHGGTCVLYPNRIPNVDQLDIILDRYGINTLWLTASLFNTVIDFRPEILKGIKQLLIGGEVLSVEHVKKGIDCLSDTQIVNGYGPTENTTFTCCCRINSTLSERVSSIPIGHPIGNTTIYLLGNNSTLVPIGVFGELHIGGMGLASSYLNSPELTAEKNVPNLFAEEGGSRLYRTGDLARYLPDGNIEFIGRVDHQVKIRGFRIELGEIESVLNQNLLVSSSVVLCHADKSGGKRLVAYVVCEESVSTLSLRRYLRNMLPQYMIPSQFVQLESMPKTPSGKVDRKKLKLLIGAKVKECPQDKYLAPVTNMEKTMARIWLQILDVEKVGLYDSFFDIGGHSLLITKVISNVKKELNIHIPYKLFFSQTLKQLAAFCQEKKST